MIEHPSGASDITHASPSGDLQAEIVRTLADTIHSLGYNTGALDMTLRPIPLEGAWGFGSAVAFQLRRSGATGNPQELAARVAAAVPHLPQLERVEAVNGYVNFYVDKNWYANRVVSQVLAQGRDYGTWPAKSERVMVEYANLNTHKAMHVGHLRNVVLGAAAFNILKAAGFDSVSATYLGDIGLHVIRVLWAYLKFYNGQEPDTNRGVWLEKLYVEATSRLEYRKRVVELITDAARADAAIAAQITIALQALVENEPESAVYAEQIVSTLLSREGPDWKGVLADRPHIVLNLWDTVGRALIAQTSTLNATNRDAAAIQPEVTVVAGYLVENGKEDTTQNSAPVTQDSEDPLADLRRDYEKLDANSDW